MDSATLDKIVEYTKQFIDATTPIAKQAYDIGLLTLRVDAAGAIIFTAVVLAASAFGLKRFLRAVRNAAEYADKANKRQEGFVKRWSMLHDTANDHLPMFWFPVGIVSSIAGALSLATLLNIWLWVKLFAPQLWLAHKAVEKLVN